MPSASGNGGKEGPAAFSVDLAAAARRLLAFLRAAPPGVGPRSVRRYEEHWLPLAAAEGGGPGGEAAMLLPPPDVQLVWLCHCFHHVRLLNSLPPFLILSSFFSIYCSGDLPILGNHSTTWFNQ